MMNNIRYIVLIFILLTSHSIPGEASTATDQLVEQEKSVDLRQLFSDAYSEFKQEKYEEASSKFLEFISIAEEDEKNYEWAQFFFGISVEKNGFSHGAVDILGNLVVKKPNTKIVNYVLDMFEKITREKPFDYDQIIIQAVNANEYDFVDNNITGFVRYYQGINDWRYGLLEWGEEHFQQIPKNTLYFYKYLYHKALYEVYLGKPQSAYPYLKNIIRMEEKNQPLIDQALWTLARLQYETKDFSNAIKNYKAIKTPLVEQASFLLEQAWIQYRLGNQEKAMGFLYAFNAPSFKQFFTPEYYILKSLIYKDLCHYDSAIKVVSDFDERYGDSLSAIYNRSTESDVDSQQLLFVIMTKPKVRKLYRFIKLLENEKNGIKELEDDNLQKHLLTIYDYQIESSAKEFRKEVKEHYKNVANGLLKYEEESNLIKYEIGIDMYQRVSETRYQEKTGKDKNENTLKNIVIFPFQGEFWNDELGNYKVSLSSKCSVSNDWEDFLE